jgi:hypothetical protein
MPEVICWLFSTLKFSSNIDQSLHWGFCFVEIALNDRSQQRLAPGLVYRVSFKFVALYFLKFWAFWLVIDFYRSCCRGYHRHLCTRFLILHTIVRALWFDSSNLIFHFQVVVIFYFAPQRHSIGSSFIRLAKFIK